MTEEYIDDYEYDDTELKIIEYRISGMSYREIGKLLRISKDKAYRVFKRFLSSPFTQNIQKIDEYRQIDLERTEEIIRAFYEGMKCGDDKSAIVILKALERRAKYLCLDDNLPKSDLKGVTVNIITKDFSQVTTDEISENN